MELPNTLHSSRKLNLLNDIDKLRSQGVNQFVDLPQLIVCGDQSSGKSSVLEAISGIPFPTKESLCTRFATEVTLRNSAEPSISVSILPDPKKSAEEREIISRFQHALSSFDSFPALIQSALDCMAVADSRQGFFQDILQVKVSGPQQPHLTIVDLPGLIHSQNKQQTAEDVKVVKSMVSQYMERPRSIILAVVSAKNDYANQIILDLAREFDPNGIRTLGIITKPDELRPDSDSEKGFVNLAQNLDVEFHLGWHVLRNRDYKEKSSTKEERDEVERSFFEQGAWRGLPRDTVGIDALRPKLSEVLFKQIKHQLPGLVRDIEAQICLCQDALARLGPPRKTLDEQRRFLIAMSQEFQHIVRDAVNGTYEHVFFGDPHTATGQTRRLRAMVQNTNTKFATTMRQKGQYREIVDNSANETEGTIKRSAYLKEVRDLMRKTRGRELPGMGNPLLVGDLFHRQSKPWAKIIESHSLTVWRTVKTFLECVVAHLCSGATSEGLLSQLLDPLMDERRKRMEAKISEILRPYQLGHPITYNHYFTDTLQKFRWPKGSPEATLKVLGYDAEKAPEQRRFKIDMEKFHAALAPRTEPDMDVYACTEILECMMSFYKVAMKSVVDNVAIYAIEQCLISDLVDMLSPSSIWEMSDELVRSISAEPAQNERQRALMVRKLEILRQGAATCQVHSSNTKEDETEAGLTFPPIDLQSPASDEELDFELESDEEFEDHADQSSDEGSEPLPKRVAVENRPNGVGSLLETSPSEAFSFTTLAKAMQTPQQRIVTNTIVPAPTQLAGATSTAKKSKKKKEAGAAP